MKKILYICITLLYLNSSLIGQNTIDKKLNFSIKKCTQLITNKNYYQLFTYSSKQILEYPSESFFHYYKAYSIYYGKEDAKLKKKISNENVFWSEINTNLKKCKNYKEFDSHFSSNIQKDYYDISNNYLSQGSIDKAIKIYNHWFELFDNSTESYKNLYADKVQDTLFGFGKKNFFSNNETKADLAFNYIFKTFYNSKYEYLYDGSIGYSNPLYNFKEYHNPKYILANTAKDEDYMLDIEKEFIYLQNLVRIDQKLFCNTFIKEYIKNNSYSLTNNYVSSLIETLEKDMSVQLIYPDKNLYKAAEYHANDMGKSGLIGHESSDGTLFFKRVAKFGTNAYGENCSYGMNTSLDILMQLLFDFGVESIGHRENILRPSFSKIGVATRYHKIYNTNTVVDYK